MGSGGAVGGGGGASVGSGGIGGTIGSGGSASGGIIGSGGASSGGMTGSGGATPTCFPRCITDLTTYCMTGGTCVKQTSGSNPVTSNICWSPNGTEAQTVTNSSNVMVTSTTTFLGQVGICYQIETSNAVPATSISYTWKLPNGTLVASGSVDPAQPSMFTIVCGGMTYMVDTASAACQSSGAQGTVPDCATAGACTF